jgi:hypothetical protein
MENKRRWGRTRESGECNGSRCAIKRAVSVLWSPPRESPRSLFMGVVRGACNNVRTVPLTTSFTLSKRSQGYYSYFTSLTTLHGTYQIVTCVPSGRGLCLATLLEPSASVPPTHLSSGPHLKKVLKWLSCSSAIMADWGLHCEHRSRRPVR